MSNIDKTNNTEDSPTLKLCPNCEGNNLELKKNLDHVLCNLCGVSGPFYDGHPGDAIDGWNDLPRREKEEETKPSPKDLQPYWSNKNIDIYQWDGRRTDFIPSDSLDLVLTSPPYYRLDHLWGELWNQLGVETLKDYNTWMQGFYNEWFRTLKGGRYAIVNTSNVNEEGIAYNNKAWTSIGLEKAGLEFVDEIIWEKHKATSQRFGVLVQHPYPRMYYPNNVHEVWLVYRKGRPEHDHDLWTEESKVDPKAIMKKIRNDIWKFSTEKAQNLGFGSGAKHVAPFPPDLVDMFIQLYTFPGERVLDPFAGGGTTGDVCSRRDRKSIMIDIDSNNCDIMISRYEEMGMLDV